MKMIKCLSFLWVTATLVLAGCNKTPQVADEMEVNGVKVALPKLQKSMATCTDKDAQASLSQVMYQMRYRSYDIVHTELTKLAANPALNDEQKKLAATVDEQVKQVAAKAPAQ